MPAILIIDDDLTIALMLSTWLKKKDFQVDTVSSVADAKREGKNEKYDLILSDLRLPDGDGIEILTFLKQDRPNLPFIIMTNYAEIQTAVKAMKQGASDYIAKPLNPDELLLKIKELLPKKTMSLQKQKEISGKHLEGQSNSARQMYEHIRLVAPTNMSVLITGSSGTGKEYIARLIHEQSNRKDAPFVAVDCGAIPKDLSASEFFGHLKGSFTGAIDNKTGAFVAANGGTLFLDEIGNLTYEIQVQLLRALQERRVRPVGSNQEIPIDVRLISATNENLKLAMEVGDFREDLYHRINEFSVKIPDLKERQEDILLFANHFLDLANQELNKNIIDFNEEVIRLFLSYSWPGNLRQMKNAVKYATLLTSGKYITYDVLPQEMKETIEEQQTPPVKGLKDEKQERSLIEKALQQVGNNKSKAAQLLGIDRKTLYNKIKLYKLDL